MSDAPDRDRRHQVWRALKDSAEPLGIDVLARRFAVHPNTIRFHLEALQHDGRVERVTAARTRPGRPAQRFRAVTGMDPAGARHYLLLARLLVESLATTPYAAARAAEAGRAWGRIVAAGSADSSAAGSVAGPADRPRRDIEPADGPRAGGGRADDPAALAGTDAPAGPLDRLVALLADLGFAPDGADGAADGDDLVRLRHCPFLELARQRPDVVCSIHLGLMQGALAQWGAAVTVNRLQPFAEPDLCTAHLAVAA